MINEADSSLESVYFDMLNVGCVQWKLGRN